MTSFVRLYFNRKLVWPIKTRGLVHCMYMYKDFINHGLGSFKCSFEQSKDTSFPMASKKHEPDYFKSLFLPGRGQWCSPNEDFVCQYLSVSKWLRFRTGSPQSFSGCKGKAQDLLTLLYLNMLTINGSSSSGLSLQCLQAGLFGQKSNKSS